MIVSIYRSRLSSLNFFDRIDWYWDFRFCILCENVLKGCGCFWVSGLQDESSRGPSGRCGPNYNRVRVEKFEVVGAYSTKHVENGNGFYLTQPELIRCVELNLKFLLRLISDYNIIPKVKCIIKQFRYYKNIK